MRRDANSRRAHLGRAAAFVAGGIVAASLVAGAREAWRTRPARQLEVSASALAVREVCSQTPCPSNAPCPESCEGSVAPSAATPADRPPAGASAPLSEGRDATAATASSCASSMTIPAASTTHRAPASAYARFGKRALDVAVSLAAMPFVAIVCAGAAVAIKHEDGGPVFYNAPRVGQYGRAFTMYKLRSMRMNAPDLVCADGSTYSSADDPRATRTGAFLRATSLDELPQFLNVLKGDMSVIGPRPDLAREAELYEGEEALKLDVRPGITGYAAVYGRNAIPWRARLALDVHYVKHLSAALDARVFARTFAAVLSRKGIYSEER